MDHEKIRELISSYLDGELDDQTRKTVEEHLASCRECRKEYEEMEKFEEVMGQMTFKNPPKEFWDLYWTSVYNRLERGIGWAFLSLGAIVLLFFGAYKIVEGIIRDSSTPLLLKVGLLLFLAGVVVLLVSIIREQFFLRKRERYKEIEK
jgi:predicted anti-sigma-YlaC factor YlaD